MLSTAEELTRVLEEGPYRCSLNHTYRRLHVGHSWRAHRCVSGGAMLILTCRRGQHRSRHGHHTHATCRTEHVVSDSHQQ